MQEVYSEERRKERTNPAPQWAVPRELIEWQPSYTQSGALRCLCCSRNAPSLLNAGGSLERPDHLLIHCHCHCHEAAQPATLKITPPQKLVGSRCFEFCVSLM